MTSQHATLLRDTRRLLLIFLGLGFLMLTTDVFLAHYFTIRSIRPAQWMPIVFGPLASGVTFLTATRFTPRTLKLFRVFGILAIGVGSLGLSFHLYAIWRALDGFEWQTLAAILRHAPPLLAPTSFAAFGLMGVMLTSDVAVARLTWGLRAPQRLLTSAGLGGSPTRPGRGVGRERKQPRRAVENAKITVNVASSSA